MGYYGDETDIKVSGFHVQLNALYDRDGQWTLLWHWETQTEGETYLLPKRMGFCGSLLLDFI